MGGSFKFCVQNNSLYPMNLSIDSNNWNCVDTEFCTPDSFIGKSRDIGPGDQFTWTLYHKTGHGCDDGKQAEFQAKPKFSIPDGGSIVEVDGAFQRFWYDNNGGVEVNGPTWGLGYYSQIFQAAPGQDATWTITPYQCYVTIVNNYTQPLTTDGGQTVNAGQSWQQWAGDLAIAVPEHGVTLLEDLGSKLLSGNGNQSRGLRISNSVDGNSSICSYKDIARLTIAVDVSGHVSYTGVDLSRLTPPPIEIPLETVRKFAPEIHFHEFEPFFPCSIEFLLKGATLLGSSGVVKFCPTTDDLAQFCSGDHHVEIAFSQTPGQFVRGFDNKINIAAPMYFAVQNLPKGSIAITYLIICAHNGSLTVCFIPSTNEARFWCILNDYARHPGDLERVTVYLTPNGDDYEIDHVTFEADGDATDYKKGDVELTDTHVKVHSALNSHGTWNLLKSDTWRVQYAAPFVEIGAALAGCETHNYNEGPTTGIIWNPTDFRFLGLDGTGQPLGDETWAKFAGRLGGHVNNYLRDGRYLDYDGNRDVQRGLIDDKRAMRDNDWFQVSTIDNIAEMLGKINSKYHGGDGPLGPATRDYINNRNPKE